MTVALSSAWFLLAVMLSLGEWGHIFPGLGAVLALLAVAAYLGTLWPRGAAPARAQLLQGGALLVGAALCTRLGEPGALAALGLVAAAALRVSGDDERACAARMQLLALGGFALFWPLYRQVGPVWHGLEALAYRYAAAVGRLSGESYQLSATAVALPGAVLAALLVLSRGLLSRGHAAAWTVRSLGVLLLFHALGLASLNLVAMVAQGRLPMLDFLLFNPQPLLFVFLSAALWLTFRRAPGWAVLPARGFGWKAALPALIGAMAWSAMLAWSPAPRAASGRVLLFDRGFLDWKLPRYGTYGQRSAGMFGLLPRFLTALGYSVEISPDSLVERHLAGYRCVVLINVNSWFSPREREDLRRWVQRGGSLLVLGDHTGIAGIRGPFNELLQPFGIRYRFDCGQFEGNSWEYSYAPVSHPLLAGRAADDELQIWVGASLEADPPARPVVLARYGYSDWGEPSAYAMSYLGDRKFNPGEQLGDLLLVAERRYGRGTVLVFGDTSPFQSGALVRSQRFVERCFRYLMGFPGPGPAVGIQLLALSGLALALFVLGRPQSVALAALLALPLGTALGVRLADLPADRMQLTGPRTSLALVDDSHVERFDTLSWYDDCVGGLGYNIMRAGYLPRWVDRRLAEELDKASLLFVIAPARPFGPSLVQRVDRFVQRGGWLFLTVGYEERDGSRPLLEHFGFDVRPSPFAQFEVEVGGQLVRFNEGWPLEVRGSNARILVRQWDAPVVALRRVGRGGVLVIGDSSFFLNRNLEGEQEAFEGNVLFLRGLFESIRKEMGRS